MNKIEFDKEKISKIIDILLKYMPYVLLTIFIAVNVYLCYYTVVSRVDVVKENQGIDALEKLDLRFDSNFLEELISRGKSEEQTSLNNNKDPFTSF